MTTPAKEGLFDGNISQAFTLACMQRMYANEILHKAPIFCDNAFSAKIRKINK